MINIGRIERYKSLYEDLMLFENHLKNPLDQVIFYRIKIFFNYNFKEVNSKSNCQESITKGLKLVEELTEQYDYFKFLMLNAIAIYHSININTIESEKYHLLSYEYIKKRVCLETKHTLRRIALMQYCNKKFQETIKTLEKVDQIPTNPNIVQNLELDGHIQLNKGMAYLYTNDLNNGMAPIELGHKILYNDFFIERHNFYMQDMAAVYKNEQNLKSLYDLKKKQLNLILIIIIFIAILFVALIYSRFKSKANKILQKEIKKRDFIYSMIGHDLSSPILAMDNTLNHIEMTLNDRLTSTQKSYISQLKSEINGAHYLLLNLLHWYKSDIELFGNKLGKSTSSIKNNIDQSVQHLFLQSKEIPVIFKNECADHIVYNLNVDMFNTVLRNIIDNAIKHSECTIITVNAIIRNEKLLVTIHDNGNGMDPKFVKSFNQSNSIYDLNSSEIKIGLGTIFILEFAKSMNSTIKIISNIEGSTYNWEIDK
jgi:signal transduction histidine kinase